MAKAGFWLNGAKGTLAGSVLSPSPVGTVIREKVTPSNPRTEAQVTQRAKLKLISQLSAVMAPVIAIPKQKGLSARNIFVSKNIENVLAHNGEASIILDNIQLTNSNVGLPNLHVSRTEDENRSHATVSGTESSVDLSRVVYCVFLKNAEGNLTLVDSKIVDNGSTFDWEAELLTPDTGDCVIYAYGARDLNVKATATYKNYKVQSAQDFASLIYNRQLSTTDMKLTKTRGVELLEGQQSSIEIPEGYAGIYLSSRPANSGYWRAWQTSPDGGDSEDIVLNNGVGKFHKGWDVAMEFTGKNEGVVCDRIVDIANDTKYVHRRIEFENCMSLIDLVAETHEDLCEIQLVARNTNAPTSEISPIEFPAFNDLYMHSGQEEEYGSILAVEAPASYVDNGTTYVFKGWLATIAEQQAPPAEYYSTDRLLSVRLTKALGGQFSAWYGLAE